KRKVLLPVAPLLDVYTTIAPSCWVVSAVHWPFGCAVLRRTSIFTSVDRSVTTVLPSLSVYFIGIAEPRFTDPAKFAAPSTNVVSGETNPMNVNTGRGTLPKTNLDGPLSEPLLSVLSAAVMK